MADRLFTDKALLLVGLMQDALADRDLVHRQTAATVVQHLALGVAGLSCEDALTHLLNFVWPNVFEDSPHLINGVMGAIDGCRLALGPCIVLHYTLQVCVRACSCVDHVLWACVIVFSVGSFPAW